MGDCILEILLREKGLIEKNIPENKIDYFIACAGDVNFEEEGREPTGEDEVIKLTAKLRAMGFKTDFSYKTASLGKQLKEASIRNAKYSIIIGEELKDNKLAIKDMATGEQLEVDYDEFLSNLKSQ